MLLCTCDKLYLAGLKQKFERNYKGLKRTCGAVRVMHCVTRISSLPVSGRVAAGAEPELTKPPGYAYEHLDKHQPKEDADVNVPERPDTTAVLHMLLT